MRTLLEKVRRSEDLTASEAGDAMGAIMDGHASPVQVAALLMGLALKGERPLEVAGFAAAMRARAVALPAPLPDVFDTCGTGGDGGATFNVSTGAAIVLAGCGLRIAKHGNRGASSRCGSADIFEGLGCRLDAPPERSVAALVRAGIGFFFAPQWHPSMRHAGPIRKELGVRTVFNLLGPLTNPARPARQLVGVSRPEQTELLARALGALGSERAWVVHGADGVDELSTTGYTKVSELSAGAVRTFYVHPADAGLPVSKFSALASADSVSDRVAVILDIVRGVPGPRRQMVLFNAAAALLVAGRVPSLREGVALAAEAIDTGRAAQALSSCVEVYRA